MRYVYCCWGDLLKHIEQIHRVQSKRWQFTFFIHLQFSTNICTIITQSNHLWTLRTLPKWTFIQNISHAVHSLQQRCLYQGHLVAFEALFISMYIHCKYIYSIRLRPSYKHITFILTSVWLHFIVTSALPKETDMWIWLNTSCAHIAVLWQLPCNIQFLSCILCS
jgi:hypothetical protein